jgi:hypothetical protein
MELRRRIVYISMVATRDAYPELAIVVGNSPLAIANNPAARCTLVVRAFGGVHQVMAGQYHSAPMRSPMVDTGYVRPA